MTLIQMPQAKYYIYRNLTAGTDVFSIRYRGKVIDRDNWFEAENVTFKVNESGRKRVLEERQKNVHAFVVAENYTFTDGKIDGRAIITYNPYTLSYFTCNGLRIDSAKRVLFRYGKCYLIDK
jgi:hypothetical protein